MLVASPAHNTFEISTKPTEVRSSQVKPWFPTYSDPTRIFHIGYCWCFILESSDLLEIILYLDTQILPKFAVHSNCLMSSSRKTKNSRRFRTARTLPWELWSICDSIPSTFVSYWERECGDNLDRSSRQMAVAEVVITDKLNKRVCAEAVDRRSDW